MLPKHFVNPNTDGNNGVWILQMSQKKLRFSLTCQWSHSSGTWQFQLISSALITTSLIYVEVIHLVHCSNLLFIPHGKPYQLLRLDYLGSGPVRTCFLPKVLGPQWQLRLVSGTVWGSYTIWIFQSIEIAIQYHPRIKLIFYCVFQNCQ